MVKNGDDLGNNGVVTFQLFIIEDEVQISHLENVMKRALMEAGPGQLHKASQHIVHHFTDKEGTILTEDSINSMTKSDGLRTLLPNLVASL